MLIGKLILVNFIHSSINMERTDKVIYRIDAHLKRNDRNHNISREDNITFLIPTKQQRNGWTDGQAK